jgi:hypothetical protein
MKRSVTSFASSLFIASALMAAAPLTFGAESGETTQLTTQTTQMDSLAGTRGQTTVTGKISSDFTTFAGSSANSDALVTGLRNGTPITLTSTDAKGVTTSTTFTPATGKMGYGNVYISLSLAKQQLAGMGITEPTAEQIQAALNGGTITAASGQTTTMTGVLQMRADGMGWGQIAQSLGYKLGPVISGMKSANAQIAKQPTTTTGGTTTTSKSGIVTGTGASAASGQGQGRAYGRGIVTGAGTGVTGSGQGNAYGRGIVTGSGSAAGQAGASAAGQGKAVGKGN